MPLSHDDSPASAPPSAAPASSTPILSYQSGVGQAEAFVRVAFFSHPFEANLARAALEAEGIRCIVGGETNFAATGGYGQPMNGIDLAVQESDVKAAREILDQIEARRAARMAKSAKCPKCSGGAVASKPQYRGRIAGGMFLAALCLLFVPRLILLTAVLSVAALILYLCTARAQMVCRKCGAVWYEDEMDKEDEAKQSEDGKQA